jgi:hypothetical protein
METLNKHRYLPVTPDTFQVGDVVEVSVSFVAYPLAKDKYMLKLQMRALCMVNNRYREVCPSGEVSEVICDSQLTLHVGSGSTPCRAHAALGRPASGSER